MSRDDNARATHRAEAASNAVQPEPDELRSGSQQGLRAKVAKIIGASWFEPLIIGLIVLNAIMIGLETSKSIMAEWGKVIKLLDKAVIAIFIAEISMRMFVHGRKFWRDPWSLFDFFTVAITIMPATGNLSILRSLRIIRALRLISAVPSMRRVVAGLLAALPGMGSVTLLLLLLTYVSSVMATQLYGDTFPELFGSIGASAYTLFQIMTLEGWSGNVVRPVMEKIPNAWMFFIPFIIISTFMVLNLFLGIVVDAIGQQTDQAEADVIDVVESDHDKVMGELAALRLQIAALHDAQLAEAAPREGGTASTSAAGAQARAAPKTEAARASSAKRKTGD